MSCVLAPYSQVLLYREELLNKLKAERQDRTTSKQRVQAAVCIQRYFRWHCSLELSSKPQTFICDCSSVGVGQYGSGRVSSCSRTGSSDMAALRLTRHRQSAQEPLQAPFSLGFSIVS